MIKKLKFNGRITHKGTLNRLARVLSVFFYALLVSIRRLLNAHHRGHKSLK